MYKLSKKTELITFNYTRCIQVKFAKKSIYGDLATLVQIRKRG